MRSAVLRRAGRSWWLVLVMALLFFSGVVGSTLGYFDGETDNDAVFAGGYVGAPTNQTATASGYDGVITWTTPDTTGVQGQRILMKDNGSLTDCTAVTYDTTVVSDLPASAGTYTDSNRTSAASGNGDQFCYAVESYWTTTSWTQSRRAAAAQLGLAVQQVQIQNGQNANKLDSGDTIVLTFNQPPATPADATICTFHLGTGAVSTILIGDPACSNTGDAYGIAMLTNLTVGGVGHQKRGASVSVAGNVMTVTVTQNGQSVSGVPSSTFTASASVQSAATTDQASACTAATANCSPAPTGSF